MKIISIAVTALVVWVSLTPASAQNTFKLASTLTATYGATPAEVVAADVNGDGKVDLISAANVYTNNGKGVFTSFLPSTTAPLNIRSNFLVADVNRDGWLDIVALTNLAASPYTESLVVYTNSGRLYGYSYNSFSYGVSSITAAVGNEVSPASGTLASAGDVFGNGLANFWYFNAASNTVCLFTNNGTGAFGSNFTFGAKLSAPLAVDVNRDGKVDFVGLGYTNNLVYIYTNNGGGFGSNAAFFVKSPTNIFTADVNGDGWADLIVLSVTNYQNISYEPVTTLTIWTNNGSGTFGSNTTFTVGSLGERVNDLKVAPLFANGQVQLACALFDAYHITGYLMVYTNNSAGGFGSNAAVSVGSALNPLSLAVADVNGDGALDLVSANYGNSSGTLTVFTNAGNGTASGSFLGNANTLPVSTNFFNLSAADLYRNGKVELIASGFTNIYGTRLPALLILTNNGTGAFGSNTLVSGFAPTTGGYPYFISAAPVMADIYGNGTPAMLLLLTNLYPSYGGMIMVLTNNGAGVFSTNSAISTTAFGYTLAPHSVTVADVNHDGKLDLILTEGWDANYYSGVVVLTNNGAGGFATNTLIDLSSILGNNYYQPATPLAVVDIYHHGRPDLAFAYNSYSSTYLTVFTNLSSSGVGPAYNGASIGNANYLIAPTKISPSAMVAADVNGDGNVDFVIANNNNPGSLIILTNTGFIPYSYNSYHFFPSFSPVVGAFPHALVAADVNGDGKVDLISANWGSTTNPSDLRGPLSWGSLTVLTNNGAGGFTNQATFSVGHGPTALLAADVNGDGQVDLITGNVTTFTNQSSPGGTNWYGQGGFTLSVLLNTSSAVNAVVLQSLPTPANAITYGQNLNAAGLTGGAATNLAGATVTGTFAFNNTNAIPGVVATNLVTFTPTAPTDYQPVTFSVGVTVNPLTAVLIGNRPYDSTSTVLANALAVSNKVGYDDVTVTMGSVDVGTPNVGTNAIVATNGLALGGNTAINYTLNGVSGSVITTQAVNNITLTSSANPTGIGNDVNFTAALPAYATGTIQFLTNTLAFDTEPLAAGVATSITNSTLPLGSNVITAIYSGDANNQAVTNSLGQLVVPPTFSAPAFVPGGLAFSGSYGHPGQTYYILAATDVSLPTSQWQSIYTNTFDFTGSFNFTNPLTPDPGVYFILEVP